MAPRTEDNVVTAVRAAGVLILSAYIATFVVMTIHWPLVGDASLMHYVAFLMDHGMSPYRDIVDMNMPGAILTEFAVIHTFGAGSLAWRVFDLSLIGTAILAMVAIAWPVDWSAGIFAGTLLGLIHGSDGIFDMGQRDFVVAVLLLISYAALFRARRAESPRWMLVFGVCAGIAVAIKPTFLLFFPANMAALIFVQRRQGISSAKSSYYATAGFFLPLVGITLQLYRDHSVVAFLGVVKGVMLYHAGLARRPLGFLLVHSVSPLLPLLLLWAVSVPLLRNQRDKWERAALSLGVLCGLISYVVQAKGYPYQRYPVIALLLLLMAIDFGGALRTAGLPRIVGLIGIAFGILVLAPRSTWLAVHYDWRNTEFLSDLGNDLDHLGGSALSGQVQCIDTIGGCYDALYQARLVQSNGFLYDEFLFGPERRGIVAASRRRFWDEVHTHPPSVIIVTDGLFPSGPGKFEKLALWPEFNDYLRNEYSLYDQVTPPDMVFWWARKDLPASYRIYRRLP
jgi:hypothetical protein